MEKYDHLFFRRSGGGNKEFTVKPDLVNSQITLHINRYAFRDTSFNLRIPADSCFEMYNLIKNILDGSIDISGNIKKQSKPTGTWVKIYAVKNDGTCDEILNPDVKDTLMNLEKLIKK